MKMIVVMIGMGLLCFFDIKQKKLPVWLLITMGVIGVCSIGIEQIAQGITSVNAVSIGELILRIMPGIMFLGIAKLTEEQIGYGDGMVTLILGLYLSIRELMMVLLGAFGINFIVSVVLLLTKKGNKKTEIPFVPGMLLGMIGMICLCRI